MADKSTRKWGQTPLQKALKNNHHETGFFLLDGGAKGDFNIFTRLDLSHLGLEALPQGLGLCGNLKELAILGNPLRTVPVAVRSGGSQAILAYARDIAVSGRTPWRKAKVMVLGREGVGKTHLLRRLQSVKYDCNLSTNGISINEFTLGDVELTWFDFGGQEVFYPTHQFFLTPQCVYLVVFRLDDSNLEDRVQHWLRTIAQFALDPKRPTKIVLVATYADVVTSKKEQALIWARLEPLISACGHVTATVTVSCKSGQGFDALRTAIDQAINLGGLCNCDVPKSYVAVWAALLQHRSSGRYKLDVATFRAEEFPDLSEVAVEGACRFLHHAGLCCYSVELQLVVTEPRWLADLFADVISFCSGVRNGIVTSQQLAVTWKDCTAQEMVDRMALFEKFQVAFPRYLQRVSAIPFLLSIPSLPLSPLPVPNNRVSDGAWVIPSMLKEQSFAKEPKRAERARRKFERIYKLQVMPGGLVGRLIVRLLELVKMVDMWRNGMQFDSLDGSELGQAVLETGTEGHPLLCVQVMRGSVVFDEPAKLTAM